MTDLCTGQVCFDYCCYSGSRKVENSLCGLSDGHGQVCGLCTPHDIYNSIGKDGKPRKIVWLSRFNKLRLSVGGGEQVCVFFPLLRPCLCAGGTLSPTSLPFVLTCIPICFGAGGSLDEGFLVCLFFASLSSTCFSFLSRQRLLFLLVCLLRGFWHRGFQICLPICHPTSLWGLLVTLGFGLSLLVSNCFFYWSPIGLSTCLCTGPSDPGFQVSLSLCCGGSGRRTWNFFKSQSTGFYSQLFGVRAGSGLIILIL